MIGSQQQAGSAQQEWAHGIWPSSGRFSHVDLRGRHLRTTQPTPAPLAMFRVWDWAGRPPPRALHSEEAQPRTAVPHVEVRAAPIPVRRCGGRLIERASCVPGGFDLILSFSHDDAAHASWITILLFQWRLSYHVLLLLLLLIDATLFYTVQEGVGALSVRSTQTHMSCWHEEVPD